MDEVGTDEMGTDEVGTAGAGTGPVTAVNVLLELDRMMLDRCEADNAGLLSVFPQGFPLDEAHRPHITLLQRFVHTDDLARVFAAAQQVVAGVPVRTLALEAHGYYYIPSGDLGLAGIVARSHPTLVEVQERLIDALAPFTVVTGDSSAFVTTPTEPVIDPLLIDYVGAFVPASTGDRFNPHITIGVAPRAHLDVMLAEPFELFAFSAVGAAVYQLGQYGTAARKLHHLDTGG